MFSSTMSVVGILHLYIILGEVEILIFVLNMKSVFLEWKVDFCEHLYNGKTPKATQSYLYGGYG